MNYLETMKNIIKNKERRLSNLILLVVLCVIILIFANYSFKDNSNKSTKINDNSNSTSTNGNINNNGIDEKYYSLESKLSTILSQIQGLSDVSVVLSYSEDSKQNIVYDSKEETREGQTTVEKTVAYNEEGNNKSAVVESVELPKIEGAIVVAKGANNVDIRSKIASAVSSVTNIPVYKVQVFEKQG